MICQWGMAPLKVKLQFIVLTLTLSSAVFLHVTANSQANPTQNSKDQLDCFMTQSCTHTCSSRCVINGSKASLGKNETEYNGILVMTNHTGCQTILLPEMKVRQIGESCEVLIKRCMQQKQVDLRCIQEKSRISGLEITFKCPQCSGEQNFTNVSSTTHACLTLRMQCRIKQDEPNLSEEEGIDRKVEKHTNTTICLVMLCLLLEILVCVSLNLWLWQKHRRSVTLVNENSTSNPSYQRGLQILHGSNSPQTPDTGQETYQAPYQPLVMNTRGPGLSEQYTKLTERFEENHRRNHVVDLASYQDLIQNETREGVGHGYMIRGEQESLRQRDASSREENTEEEDKEPFYHVLEGPDPTEESPRSPVQQSNSSQSHREPLYCVLRELRSRNAIDQPNRVPSNETNEEPIYHVLENPAEVAERAMQGDKL